MKKKKFSRDKESKIRAITKATIELIGEKGPNFSVNEIPKKAGLSIGTVYRYFPRGKADILSEALRRNIREFLASIKKDALDIESLKQMWANVISEYVELKRDYLPASELLVEIASQNTELYEELSLIVLGFYRSFAQNIRKFDFCKGLPEDELIQRVGLSFAVMQTVVRVHSSYHVFRSDDGYKNYLLRVVLAAFEH
ncbi:MAG: TetR/AcrR family transcriptional regulator [Candidatus Bathyarchaeia archaeon]